MQWVVNRTASLVRIRCHNQTNIDHNINFAEIGTYEGKTLKYLYNSLSDKIIKYYIVDPYEEYEDYDDSSEDIRANNKLLKKAEIKMKNFIKDKENIVFYKENSLSASKKFEPESLDIIFIDGNHKYEYVYDDINTWKSKVKKGGFLVGHDYGYPEMEGVAKAVDKLLGKENIVLEDDFIWIYKV